MIRSPFVWHEGMWFVIVEWVNGPPADEFRIRQLTDEETAVLDRYRDDCDAEAWAVIAGKNQ